MLAEDLGGCVESPEGRHRHEIVLPLVRKEAREADAAEREEPGRAAASAPGEAAVRRVFPPGDEWLFLKIYAAPVSGDRLLREVVAPLAALHREREPEAPWFFLRYSDPENHLRARFRASRETQRLLDDRAAELTQPLFRDGLAHRMSVDTYVREIERYGGGRGIELAEDWFRLDSEAALAVLRAVEETGDEGLRWRAALLGFDRLLGRLRALGGGAAGGDRGGAGELRAGVLGGGAAASAVGGAAAPGVAGGAAAAVGRGFVGGGAVRPRWMRPFAGGRPEPSRSRVGSGSGPRRGNSGVRCSRSFGTSRTCMRTASCEPRRASTNWYSTTS